MPNTYYRLLCLQGTGYMGTGYNATSLGQLADEYADYKSIDWEEDEMRAHWKGMTLEQQIDFIRGDEFEIEVSPEPFDEADIH